MATLQRPADAMVVNGWYLEIPIPGITNNAIFETLEGLGKSTGTVEIVDAGTNAKHKFSDQLIDYSEMTLTRTYQNNGIDRAMETLVSSMIQEGIQLPVRAVKMHFGKEVFSVLFEGFCFRGESHPTWDIGGSDKYSVSYTATCHAYTVLPAVGS